METANRAEHDPRPGRVYVVDDDRISLVVLTRVLTTAGYTVEPFESPLAFLAAVRADRPCCLVLDLKMPEIDGVDVVAGLARRGLAIPVVFISGEADVPSAVQAMKTDPFDFLCKPVAHVDLLRAVRGALARDVERRAATGERDAAKERFDALSEREREVCERVARGLLNKQIAAELGLDERTVKHHRARGLAKLGVETIPDLVRLFDRAVRA